MATKARNTTLMAVSDMTAPVSSRWRKTSCRGTSSFTSLVANGVVFSIACGWYFNRAATASR